MPDEIEKCLNCSGEVAKGYKYCKKCYLEYQEKQAFKGIPDLIKSNEENTALIIKQLEKNNNNLYNLTKCFSVVLQRKFNCAVVWDKKTNKKKGDFVIKELK